MGVLAPKSVFLYKNFPARRFSDSPKFGRWGSCLHASTTL